MPEPLPPLPLFDGLDDPALREELRGLPVRRFPRGMLIFDRGDPSQEMYVVTAGAVELLARPEEGGLRRLELLSPGALFGEAAYLTGAPRSQAAVALEEARVLELSPEWLAGMLRRHPAAKERLDNLYRSGLLPEVLKGCPLLARLDAGALEKLAFRMELREVADGTEFLREGSRALELFAVKKGRVVLGRKEGEKILRLEERAGGGILGESEIVSGRPHSASAFAQGPLEIAVLSEELFRNALETEPALQAALEERVRSRAEEEIFGPRFEYESGGERAAVETLLKDLARDAGSGADRSRLRTEAPARSRFDRVLTKHFASSEQFFRTCLGSTGAGALRVETKEPLEPGTPVRLHASVRGQRALHRLTLTGLVRARAQGAVEVELDEFSASLRMKVGQLCAKLLEDRRRAAWEKRKRALAAAGVRIGKSGWRRRLAWRLRAK